MITLFAEPPRPERYSVTFVVSIVLHASLLSLLTIKVMHAHRVIENTSVDRYSLRVLNFHSIEPYVRQSSAGGIEYHGPKSAAKTGASSESKSQSSAESSAEIKSGPPAPAGEMASAASSTGSPATMRQAPRLLPAPQTLVQPDVKRPLAIPEKTPVPLVVLWSADKMNAPRIVPPMPERPTIAIVHPTLDTPIKEENLADLKISSTMFVTQTPAAPPSTTSPLLVHGPEEVKKVTETTSKQPEKPTPARVISLSDIRTPEGKVAVPLANQASAKTPAGSIVPGVLKDPSPAGKGESTSKSSAVSAGKGAGDRPVSKADSANGNGGSHAGAGGKAATVASNPNPNPGPGSGSGQVGVPAAKGGKPGMGGSGASAAGGPKTAALGSPNPGGGGNAAVAAAGAGPATQTGAALGPPRGSATGSGNALPPGAVRISLPKDGQFGVVVLGSSIEDKYPETAELWSGRLASTVYLHVGAGKSWILQYALPRLTDASTGGGRVEAPWPYEIVRPNLSVDDLDSDALILHGIVNKDGRFEKLEVVFPPQFVQAQMVLNVFNQWQFRPAKLNGEFAPVEVLLIIPQQTE